MWSSSVSFWFLLIEGACGVEHLEELVTRTRHPGTDRTDRNAEEVSGLVIAQPGQLGEHERRSTVVVELVQQLLDLHALIDGDVLVERVVCHAQLALFVLAAATTAPRGIGTGAPCDGEQPMLRRACRPVAMHRCNRSLVGLLCQIVCIVTVAEVATHGHDVVLGRRDEPLERVAVSALRVEEERRQVVHAKSVCRGNQTVSRADRHIVEATPGASSAPSCEEARVLISAASDDELHHDEQRWLDNHLDRCPVCRSHVDAVASLNRSVRVRSARFEPDLVATVMSRSRPARLGRGGWLRPALAWCGVLIAAQSVRPLVFGEIDGTPTHIARHVGASGLALAIGLLYAAWRPHRAFGLLPFVGALLVTTMLGAVLDTLSGQRSALAEMVHLAEAVGLVLLWMVAGSPGWDRARSAWRTIRHHGGVARPTS